MLMGGIEQRKREIMDNIRILEDKRPQKLDHRRRDILLSLRGREDGHRCR